MKKILLRLLGFIEGAVALPIYMVILLFNIFLLLISPVTSFFFKKKHPFVIVPILGRYYSFCFDFYSYRSIYTGQALDDRTTKVVIKKVTDYHNLNSITVSNFTGLRFIYFDIKNNANRKLFYVYFKEGNKISIISENKLLDKSNLDYLEIIGVKAELGDSQNISISIVFRLRKTFREWDSLSYFSELKRTLPGVSIHFDKKNMYGDIQFELEKIGHYNKLSSLLKTCFKQMQNAFALTESYLKSTLDFRYILPNYFKTPIQQYLVFFDEYVKFKKNKSVNISTFKVEDGISIVFKPDEVYSVDDLKSWLFEYMELLKTIDFPFDFNQKDNSFDSGFLSKLSQQVKFTIRNLMISISEVNHDLNTHDDSNSNLIYRITNEAIDKIYLLERNKGKRITREDLYVFIENDHIVKLIEILKYNIGTERTRNDIILVGSRYKAIKRDRDLGLVKRDEFELVKNQCIERLLDLISNSGKEYFYLSE